MNPGLYGYIDGKLLVIANKNTTIPGTRLNFITASDPIVLEDGTAAFKGGRPGHTGIYRYDKTIGSLSKIVDTNTLIPGGIGTFTAFGARPITIGGGDIAFAAFGSSGQTGIYKITDGTLSLVVDQNSPVPGQSDLPFFSFHGMASLGDGDIAFRGREFLFDQDGIYIGARSFVGK